MIIALTVSGETSSKQNLGHDSSLSSLSVDGDGGMSIKSGEGVGSPWCRASCFAWSAAVDPTETKYSFKVTSHLARPTLLNFALRGKYARYLSETCHVPWLINEEYTSMIKIKVV